MHRCFVRWDDSRNVFEATYEGKLDLGLELGFGESPITQMPGFNREQVPTRQWAIVEDRFVGAEGNAVGSRHHRRTAQNSISIDINPKASVGICGEGIKQHFLNFISGEIVDEKTALGQSPVQPKPTVRNVRKATLWINYNVILVDSLVS